MSFLKAILVLLLLFPVCSWALPGSPLISLPKLAVIWKFDEVFVTEEFDKFVISKKVTKLEKEFDGIFYQRGDFIYFGEKKGGSFIVLVFSGFTLSEAPRAHDEIHKKRVSTTGTLRNLLPSGIESAHADEIDTCAPSALPRIGLFDQLFRHFGEKSGPLDTFSRCIGEALESAARSFIDDLGGILELAQVWKWEEHLKAFRKFLAGIRETMNQVRNEIGKFIQHYHTLPFEVRFPILCAALGQFVPGALMGGVPVVKLLRSDKFITFMRNMRARFPGVISLPPLPPAMVRGSENPLRRGDLENWMHDVVRVMPDKLFSPEAARELRPHMLRWSNPSYSASVKRLDLDDFRSPSALNQHLTRAGFRKISTCIGHPKCGKNPVQIDFYLHPDGGVVKVKPHGQPGSPMRPEPHASKVVFRTDPFRQMPRRFSSEKEMRDFAEIHLHFKDEIMKVSNEGGHLLPKSKDQMPSLYPKGSKALEQLEDVLMDEAHWNLIDRRRSSIHIMPTYIGSPSPKSLDFQMLQVMYVSMAL